jgi:aromatic ring hydroxylase
LKAHPRDVWIAGRQVRDVTADAVFQRPITSLAGLFEGPGGPQ